MDREPPVIEDELHAFVDGELPAERRAVVERWLATHADDAARVAAWRAQAAAVRARYDAVADEAVPARHDVHRLARSGRNWRRLAAAAIVLALLGGGAGWFARGAWEGAGPARTVTAEAADAHRLYVVEVRHPVEVPGSEAAHLAQWLSRRIGYPLRAPDLDGAELKLVGGRLLPSSAGPGAAFFMYEAATGERFTVYCRKIVNASESSLRYRTVNMIGSFAWIEDNVAFVVSGPPDRARLRKIAEAVQEQIEAPPASRLSDARGTRR